MRRSVAITLVLLGGATAAGGALALLRRDCTDPATGLTVRCESSGRSSTGIYAGGSRNFGSASTAVGAAAGAAAAVAVSRGGFGSTGSSTASSGG